MVLSDMVFLLFLFSAPPIGGRTGTRKEVAKTGGAAVRSSERLRLPQGNGLGSLIRPGGGFISARYKNRDGGCRKRRSETVTAHGKQTAGKATTIGGIRSRVIGDGESESRKSLGRY